jgi:hypothetical protein
MKIFLIIIGFLLFSLTPVEAKDYLHYQSIVFEEMHHKFLHEFSAFDMIKHLDKLEGNRFWGWQLHPVTKREKVLFTKETVLFIHNEGPTPITQSYLLKTSEQSKIQFDTRGTITTKNKGSYKGFDLNLDAQLDIRMVSDVNTTLQEETKINIEIDSMTSLKVAIYGEGYISNGVGRYFRFFRPVREGGYEVFVLATEYYGIEKLTLK